MAEIPANTPPADPLTAAHELADTLGHRGHASQASAIRATLRQHLPGSLLFHALRETCQVVLTAIEAIDPVCAAMVEELRLEVDKRLTDEPNPPT